MTNRTYQLGNTLNNCTNPQDGSTLLLHLLYWLFVLVSILLSLCQVQHRQIVMFINYLSVLIPQVRLKKSSLFYNWYLFELINNVYMTKILILPDFFNILSQYLLFKFEGCLILKLQTFVLFTK